MKYLVLECYDSYSIVLDDEGRVLKAANMNYSVGQKLDYAFLMQEDEFINSYEDKSRKSINKKILSFATLAAMLMIVLTSIFNLNTQAVGAVFIKINPEVKIEVNKRDRVVNLEGVNPDGIELVKDVSFKNKHIDILVDELIDKAIDKGYLYDHGQVQIKVDGKNEKWQSGTKELLNSHLKNRADKDIQVSIKLSQSQDSEDTRIVIPIQGKPKDN